MLDYESTGGIMRKVLIMSADKFEDLELLVPYYRLKEAGFYIDVASKKTGKIEGLHDYEVHANKTFDEVNPDEYEMLLLPGGKAPSKIRDENRVQEIARDFFSKNKLVCAICHGPQILISAGVMEGKHATSYPKVADELKDANAIYIDREVVIEGNLITSRSPEDLPAFNREMMKRLQQSSGGGAEVTV